MDVEASAPPDSVAMDELIQPRAPWFFLKPALPRLRDRWLIHLGLAWMAFNGLTGALWAWHVHRLAGHSALPSYWGELLTARDAWEIWENGGLARHWMSPASIGVSLAALVWILWASWRAQAEAAACSHGFRPWLWGFFDALLLGAVPMACLGWMGTQLLGMMAGTGISWLGWVDVLGTSVLQGACISGFMLQWWMCRMGRGTVGVVDHWKWAVAAVWMHPVQWGLLVAAGVALRSGLSFLALLTAWKWGGGGLGRVWAFLVLDLLVTVCNAWLMLWFLKLAALFWRQDTSVRNEVGRLHQVTQQL